MKALRAEKVKRIIKIITLIAIIMAILICMGCADEKAVVVNNNVNPYFVNSINHRGWHKAPENTLSAYRESAKNGFSMVECDVHFTKDDVPVLIHDKDIDRTSNGTGEVSELLWSEISTYDFGSWKSPKYKGEKIPKFEEFIGLCKNLSLHPYIEIKTKLKAEHIKILLGIVKRYGMQDNVTWISWHISFLREVCKIYPKSRVGYLVLDLTDEVFDAVCKLRTEQNNVFVDCDYTVINEEKIDKCIENLIPLEVWVVDDARAIRELDPYISGVTSSIYVAGEILKNKR